MLRSQVLTRQTQSNRPSSSFTISPDVGRCESKKTDDGSIVWNEETEALLFQSLIGYKPVGIHRHFNMLIAHHRFTQALNHQVDINLIWKHLESMYNLDLLAHTEGINFPKKETDFELPPEFQTLKTKKNSNLSPRVTVARKLSKPADWKSGQTPKNKKN